MTIRTQLKAGKMGGGDAWNNHNETLAVRTGLKAGAGAEQGPDRGRLAANHNETLQPRTGLKAGGRVRGLAIPSALKAGRIVNNHNEMLTVRTGLKADGGLDGDQKIVLNHNERLLVRTGLKAGRAPGNGGGGWV